MEPFGGCLNELSKALLLLLLVWSSSLRLRCGRLGPATLLPNWAVPVRSASFWYCPHPCDKRQSPGRRLMRLSGLRLYSMAYISTCDGTMFGIFINWSNKYPFNVSVLSWDWCNGKCCVYGNRYTNHTFCDSDPLVQSRHPPRYVYVIPCPWGQCILLHLSSWNHVFLNGLHL